MSKCFPLFSQERTSSAKRFGFVEVQQGRVHHSISNIMRTRVARIPRRSRNLRGPLLRPAEKLGFEMPIDDYRVSTRGGDISPLNISGLLFFDAESWLSHVNYFCAI
jgi:hypothetical protein